MINNFEILHLNCCCTHVEHTIRFMYDPEDEHCPIYTEVFLGHTSGFWGRLIKAVKYVFGRKCDYGHFDCFLMEKHQALILQEFIETAYNRPLDGKTPE